MPQHVSASVVVTAASLGIPTDGVTDASPVINATPPGRAPSHAQEAP